MSLARECERALVCAARGRATRQLVRSAARSFVRKHRRDDDYLRWVLRGVGVSSALAAALLGLSAEPAHAQLAPFAARTGGANPLHGQDAGFYAGPAFGDLDGDGDRDLLAGSYGGTFVYFENTGDAGSAAFTLRTGAQNPLDGEDVGYVAAPALGDVDGDGDLDLVSGDLDGMLHYFENTGGASTPAFIARTGAANPLDGVDVGDRATPALADLDVDGDLDLVCGRIDGGFSYFANTGDAAVPQFAAPVVNPFGLGAPGVASAPALGDLDADGDLDLLTGDYYGGFFFFENTGSATGPAFALLESGAPLGEQNVEGYLSSPAFADLDADGDLDVVAGEFDGTFDAFENLAGQLVQRTGAANPLGGLGDGADSSLGDLDADGDLDLVTGAIDGSFAYFENTGSATAPAFAERTGAANPLDGENAGTDSTPSLGDLDGDGDLDLVAGGGDGLFDYFENTGSEAVPAFIARTGAANPFDAFDVGDDAAPALGDADGDGDLDLVSGKLDGAFAYFRNGGSPTSPAFALVTGALGAFDVGSRSRPALADLDGDGDGDLVAGDTTGALRLFVATVGGANPAFVERTGAASPLDGVAVSSNSRPALGDLDGDGDRDLVAGDVGSFHYFESHVRQPSLSAVEPGPLSPLAGQGVGASSRPALVDLDADGDLDLVAGESNGAFAYYENTGSATAASFVLRTGAENPLLGQDVGGASSRPALADLDADGDLDLLSGRFAGDFQYFANTGTAMTPAFAAALTNPFGLTAVDSDSSAPALGDLDGDGDLDLVSGAKSGSLFYFENTGSATSPAFIERTVGANPFFGLTGLLDYTTPAIGDFDRDGDLDLVSGEASGSFFLLRNEGSATGPVFAAASGVNPLAGEDVGTDSAPAAGDLDANGHLDLVTGALSGEFSVHYFPEPARRLLLGAGIALLGVFDRVRRRSPR